MELANLFLRSIFMGFVSWTFFWAFTKRKEFFGKGVEESDRLATGIVIALGILCFLTIAFSMVEFNHSIGVSADVADRAFGEYWLGWWIYPFTYFGLTQLLWVKHVRQSRATRILIALFIFAVIHIEHFVILVTSLHRDFSTLPPYVVIHLVINWIISSGIFVVVLILGSDVKKIIRTS
jgi:hypothetical protein